MWQELMLSGGVNVTKDGQAETANSMVSLPTSNYSVVSFLFLSSI